MASIWAAGISALLASAAVGVFWLSRVVFTRRLKAAADAYANRELARARHTPRPKAAARS